MTVIFALFMFTGQISVIDQTAQADSNAAVEPNGLDGLSPDEVSIVRRIEDYLNDLKSVSARFIQISSNGSLAEGDVNIQRPGRMRFEYDEPVPIVMIANGVTLLYFDKKLKQLLEKYPRHQLLHN